MSEVEYRSGTVVETHELATYQSLGVARGVVLNYDSLRADPRPIVHFGFDTVPSTDQLLIARVDVQRGGLSFDVPGFRGSADESPFKGDEHFWRLQTGSVRAALQIDLSDQPTGLYQYTVSSGLFRESSTGPRFVGTSVKQSADLVHVNTRQSSFGAGWGVAGLQQLVENPDGSVLIFNGDGTELLFRAPATPGGPWVSTPGDFSTLERLADGTFRRTLKDQRVYSFDAQNHLVRMRNRNGNETRYEYSQAGVLTKIIDPVGLETTFAATGGRITAITDPAGRVTQLQYDANGNLTRVTDPDGSTRVWGYDARHHMTSEVDQRGLREQTTWDAFGRVSGGIRKDGSKVQVNPVLTQGLFLPDATIDPDHPALVARAMDSATITDGNGNVNQIRLDVRGQGVAARDAIGSLGVTTRNAQNLVTAQADGRGHNTSYEYDARGNLTKVTDELSFGTPRELFPGRTFATARDPQTMAAGDLNGDGVVDLVTTHQGGFSLALVSVLMGRGDGSFLEKSDIQLTMVPKNAVLADLEGDGDLDIFVVGYNSSITDGEVSVLVNQGFGNFAQGPSATSNQGLLLDYVSVGDLDGDDDLDVVASAAFTNAFVFQTIGGNFAAPVLLNLLDAVRVVDVNRDGRLDLLRSTGVQLGNGDGTFGGVLSSPGTGGGTSVSTADLNGDGNLDRIATYTSPFGCRCARFSFGDGTGLFASEQDLANLIDVGSVVPADVDGDGDVDLVVGRTSQFQTSTATVFLNRGDGVFPEQRNVTGNLGSCGVLAVADFNRDEVPDVARVLNFEDLVMITLGNGDGTFNDRSDLGYARSVGTADLDGDGDLDLVRIDEPEFRKFRVGVLLNDGTGQFAVGTTIDDAPPSDRIELADLDGDHNVDLVTSDYSITGQGQNSISVWRGDGAGGFSTPSVVPVDRPGDLAIADLNGDDKLDIVANVTSADPGSVSVLLGNGDGTFAAPMVVPTGDHAHSCVALADVNGDHRTDVLTCGGFSNKVVVQLGNGDGTFGAPKESDAGITTTDLAVGDIDGDGFLDVLAAARSGRSISVMFGDGTGNLTARPELTALSVANLVDAVALRDVTGDGKLDLIVIVSASIGGSVIVFPNDGLGGFPSRRDFSVTPRDGRSDDSFISSFIVADVTGDHIDDLVLPGKQLSILPGSGGGERGGPRLYTYEPTFNKLTSMTDELGRQTLYQIDPANGNALAVREVVGAVGGTDDVVTRYTYTPRGQVATMTDANGHVTSYEYDSRGRLITVTAAVGTSDVGVTRFEYDAAGNVTAMIDENGNRTAFSYDAMNRLTRTTEADPDDAGPLTAPVTIFTYDPAGNLLTGTDARGNTSSFQYDARSRLTRATDARGGVATSTIDPAGNLVATTDELGRTTRYRYDARNRLIETVDLESGHTEYRYDLDDNLVSVIDPNGNLNEFKYDARSQLVRTTDALGRRTRYQFDPASQMIAATDRNAHTTRFAYDDLSRLVSVTDALGGVTGFDYDPAGNRVAVTDELNRTTEFAYDARDRLDTITDPLSHAVTYRYDAARNLISATDPLGRLTQFEYDALNRQVKQTDALGGTATSAFDAVDNLVSVTDELNRQTQFSYDALDRMISATDPLGHTSRMTYDAVGNVLTTADALNQTTRFAYDGLDRLITTTDPRGAVARYEYDPDSNLVSLTDPVGNDTTWDYDALNRVVRETNALNASRSYAYDGEGNLTSLTDRNGRVREFTYDPLNRRTAEQWLDSSGTAIRTFNFTFDAASQLQTAADPDSAYAYTYDADGRLVTTTNASTPGVPTVAFAYSFDAANNLLSRADTINGAAGRTNAYQYDALNRMTRITQSGSGVADKRVDMAYDAASQMTDITRFADLGGSQLVAFSTYTHDPAGRLIGLTHSGPPLSALGSQPIIYSWQFDAANRITQATSPDGTSTYNYDAADQLVSADHSFQTDENYSYDSAGNRTNSGYQTNPDNRLRTDGTFNYAYDAEGNRTRRTTIATGETTDYEWDHRNRLTHVVVKNTAGDVTKDIHYTYDVYDRRIAKSVDSDGPGPSAAAVDRFVYDGPHIVASFDSNGVLTHRYLHGPVIDQILADESGAGQVLWSLADYEGTVRDLINSAGMVVDHIRYDSFGSITSETNAGLDHLFTYTGRELDDETALYYFRNRYYDSVTGRFLSEDRLTPSMGQPRTSNGYQYALNNPHAFTDPFGLDELPRVAPLADTPLAATPLAVTPDSALGSSPFTPEQLEWFGKGLGGLPDATTLEQLDRLRNFEHNNFEHGSLTFDEVHAYLKKADRMPADPHGAELVHELWETLEKADEPPAGPKPWDTPCENPNQPAPTTRLTFRSVVQQIWNWRPDPEGKFARGVSLGGYFLLGRGLRAAYDATVNAPPEQRRHVAGVSFGGLAGGVTGAFLVGLGTGGLGFFPALGIGLLGGAAGSVGGSWLGGKLAPPGNAPMMSVGSTPEARDFGPRGGIF